MAKQAEIAQIIKIVPHDFDDRGLKLAPGQRVQITLSGGREFMFDRHLLQSVTDFMDKQA